MSENIDHYLLDDEDDSMRWGCVLGDKCLMPDPEHFSSECHSVEDMEALYEEWNGDSSVA